MTCAGIIIFFCGFCALVSRGLTPRYDAMKLPKDWTQQPPVIRVPYTPPLTPGMWWSKGPSSSWVQLSQGEYIGMYATLREGERLVVVDGDAVDELCC